MFPCTGTSILVYEYTSISAVIYYLVSNFSSKSFPCYNLKMKLLSLNIWGGQVHQSLIEFIKEQSKEIDVFCFQEVINGKRGEGSTVLLNAPNAVIDIYSQIQEILPQFQGYFYSAQGKDGIAIFIKKNIVVKKEGDFFVYRFKNSMEEGKANTLGRNLCYLQFLDNGKEYTIANLHGIWDPRGKGDTPERLDQSRKIMDFLNSQSDAKIFCGDLNLLPDTQSIAIIEKDMINLVKDFKITSTRTKLYDKFLNNNDQFADYIFVSKDVKVLNFKVLTNEVSDHLPLFLEFN